MISFSIASATILTHCVIIVIGMLMRCHLPSAYDSLGRFSIENLYLSSQSMIIALKLFSYDSRAYQGSLFACDARGLPFLTCLYFHVVVAIQHISFDVYVGIATYGFLIAVNLYLVVSHPCMQTK